MQYYSESHSSENSPTLFGYLGEVFSVEFRLLKVRLPVILRRWSSKKTTTQKQLELTSDLLIMFSKPLSPSMKSRTNTSLFESGSHVSRCFDLKYNYLEDIRSRLPLRVPENVNIITWTRTWPKQTNRKPQAQVSKKHQCQLWHIEKRKRQHSKRT